MSSIRIIAYEENKQNNGEAVKKNIENNHKNFNKQIKMHASNSLAVYRITPIITEDLKNISYPVLKVSENEPELKEVLEKIMKAHETNDYQNINFLAATNNQNNNINSNKEKVENEEEYTAQYELKKPDEEEHQSRTPLDKYNLIKAFCISHDTYNNRLNLEDNSNDVDLKISNMDEKLNFLFDV